MATSSCWKCLTRPSMPLRSLNAGNLHSNHTSLALSFSTSTTRQALTKQAAQTLAKKAKDRGAKSAANQKTTKTLNIKKKEVVKTGKPPAPGERKAIRKRIVLSNSNAIEIKTMVDMETELDPAQVGTVVGLPGPLVDQLRASEAFKTTQCWSLFRRPAMLIREESIEISRQLQESQEAKKTSLIIIDGGRGAGKSMMLLQAMATAFMRGWIVLSIPEAQELTCARTAYSPISGTTPTAYSQNTYTSTWLGQIAKANQAVLSSLHLAHKHTLSVALQSDASLARLAELGTRDPEIAWPVFCAFWQEITSPSRPPILLALDGLSHIMKESAYRSPEYELIHAHDLGLVRHFVDHLSGARELPNGGAVMAATSNSNSPASYATRLAVTRTLERQAGKAEEELTKMDPWAKTDLRAYESLQAASVLNLKGLSKMEARGLMEYWAASGLLRQRVDEKTVTEKWTVAGNGVIGEIEKGALRMSI